MSKQRGKDHDLPSRVYLKHGAYYFVSPDNKWIRLATSKAAAIAKYYQLVDAPRRLSNINELIDRYLLEVSPLKAATTYKSELQAAKYLRAALGHIPAEQMTTRMVYEYLDARSETAPVRANREIALLSHMFKKAIRWGAAEINPVLGVERNAEKPRDRYVTDKELSAFKNVCPDWLAAYCDLKYLTGLRQTDLLKLRWSQITDEGIALTVSKTGKKVILSWSEALIGAVEAIRSVRRPVTGLTLFHTRKGQPYTPDGFRTIFHRAMKKALEKKLLLEPFQERDIRAKSASDSASLEEASGLLTHSSGKVTERHYRRKASLIRPLK